jgi:hypothetical protein
MYNDNARCFFPPLTRDERCGTDRGIADATSVAGIVGLVVGGLSVGTGVVLLTTSRQDKAESPPLALACGIAPASLACNGAF